LARAPPVALRAWRGRNAWPNCESFMTFDQSDIR
jgi:hypothetical protein